MSTLLRLLLLCHVLKVTVTAPGPPLVVLHNSAGPDSALQGALLKGTFLGLRDVEQLESLELNPKFIDLKVSSKFIDLKGRSKFVDLKGSLSQIDWALDNPPQTIISLLHSSQLKSVCAYFVSRALRPRILTPRALDGDECGALKGTKSLQMDLESRVAALLHRIVTVGTKSLLPVLDHEGQVPLLQKYVQGALKMGSNLRFLPPLLMSRVPFKGPSNGSSLFRFDNVTRAPEEGILLLSSQGLSPQLQSHLTEEEHFFRWFSHQGPFEWDDKGALDIFGLYSVQYVGEGRWDSVQRRRLLREFSAFTGPDPSILSVALAYDTAFLAATNQRRPLPAGVSGALRFTAEGYRSQGTFVGMSTLPRAKGSALLQPSQWILEDFLEIKTGQNGTATLGDHRVATSSILSRHELLQMAQQGKGRRKCAGVEMEVLTHDPFTQMENKFNFVPDSLPEHLLIPNQYGYGLTFHCHGASGAESTILRIACSPSGTSGGDPAVHCFKSDVTAAPRRKRSSLYQTPHGGGTDPRRAFQHRSHYSKGGSYYSPREDTSMTYYQPPPSDSYYNGNGFGAYYDSSTPGTLTTRLDVPINEKPTTHAPTGGSKLPELRQILKAAKPFVGSCIGSSTGCAVCVLVLGRLPLGAVPAACTGPCFVGTFGTCGSLLGRVFSETTVICTELFRQGLMDVDTFLADAAFGQEMAKYEAETLLGYQILAAPLVQRMRESRTVTRLVAHFALPWAQHMKYLRGHSAEGPWLGHVIHVIGSTLCHLVGHLLTSLDLTGSAKSLGYSFGALSLGLLLLLRRFKN